MSSGIQSLSGRPSLILNKIREASLPQPPKTVVLSKKEVGQRIRAARQARGITQVELAKALGTYQTVVSAIERGTRGLTLQYAAKLALALGASLDTILGPTTTPKDGHLKDRRFLRRLQTIEKLSKRDKQALLTTIDKFLSSVS